jgi:hypothetical protein
MGFTYLIPLSTRFPHFLLDFRAKDLYSVRDFIDANKPAKFEGMVDVDGEYFTHYSGVRLD